jgi:transcriptional regulator ATRX
LIDNITNESKDVKPSMSKSTKRRTSNSSTTTLDSNPIEDDNDIIEEINSDSKSKKSGDDDDDDDIEIIKSYPTRSRTTMNNPSSKTMNSNVFDTENDQVPAEMSTNDLENCSEPWLDEMREQFWYPFLDALPEESKYDIELSGKFLILKFILDKCAEIGDKILLFSRSLYTLTHIEKFLKHLQIQNEKEYQKQCESRRQLRELLASNEDNDQISNEQIPEPIEWIRDRDYFRMDGQTEVITRKRYAKAFNDMTNLRARVFLISTLAGGIGINLTGSNRVIVFDASWNPR